MHALYSLLLTLVALAGLPYFVYRELRSGKYWSSLRERLGFLPRSLNPDRALSIWVHAVSVGEVLVARSLLPLLRESLPGMPLFVSVTTLTGRQIAERQLREATGVFYCPFDWASTVDRVVARVRPKVLVLVETEIWPHLIRSCRRSGAVTLLVNGRISDRSYPRYLWIRPFLRRFLRGVDGFCMQSSEYASRIIALGADPARVRVTGNLKFDAVVPPSGMPSRVTELVPPGRRVLIGGSTLAPEEEILLEVFVSLRDAHPDLFLILAPRHPERFTEVAGVAASRRLRIARRTLLESAPLDADVMVLDTLGELAALYRGADVVFVGGSLAAWGGHNLIEPAALGKPIVFGPHMSNFREMAAIFLDADAAVQVDDRRALREAIDHLLRDPSRRAHLGNRARELVEENRGAGRRTVAVIQELMQAAP